MSEFDRAALIELANELSLEFKGNISNIKLNALIAEAKGEPAPINESAPASPAEKEVVADDEDDFEEESPQRARARMTAQAKYARRRKIVAKARARAFKTHIVTLTNKDNRENDVMTTAHLGFENQYFGLSKNVPLDIPVELEQALIQIAAACTMTMHKDEIVDGKRTGNKVSVRVKKYAISYSRQDPS